MTYIIRIRGRMVYLIDENINLLDKMHEGIVVLDQDDLNLKIASQPAVTLLK